MCRGTGPVSQSLNHIEVFVRVVQARSFTRAARALSLSKATVSNHVAALEKYLGAPLLTRTTRSVNLTKVGSAFYARCLAILAELATAEAEISQAMGAPRGILRIGTTTTLADFLMTIGLKDFCERYPSIDVELAPDIIETGRLEDGWDLALRLSTSPPASPRVEQLSSHIGLLCASPDYCEHHGRPSRPSDLAGHRGLTDSGPVGSRTWLLNTGENTRTIKAKVHLQVASGALRAGLLAGLGIGLIPAFLVEEDLRAGRLLRILPDYRGARETLYTLCPHEGPLAAKVRVFVEFLRARLLRPALDAPAVTGLALPDTTERKP